MALQNGGQEEIYNNIDEAKALETSQIKQRARAREPGRSGARSPRRPPPCEHADERRREGGTDGRQGKDGAVAARARARRALARAVGCEVAQDAEQGREDERADGREPLRAGAASQYWACLVDGEAEESTHGEKSPVPPKVVRAPPSAHERRREREDGAVRDGRDCVSSSASAVHGAGDREAKTESRTH